MADFSIEYKKDPVSSTASSTSYRQRVSWILLVCYLGLTFYFIHYLFDISDNYSQLALDHAKQFKRKDRNLLTIYDMIMEHMFNVPFSWWIIILLVPYISIFALLVTCTRSDCSTFWDEGCEKTAPFFSVCCPATSPSSGAKQHQNANSGKQHNFKSPKQKFGSNSKFQ